MALFYPENEKKELKDINDLMKRWKKEVSKSKVKYRDDGEYYTGDTWFSPDGFLPFYFSQHKKVLFVAREDRQNWNTVKEWMKIFKEAKLPQKCFFVPLLKILYGFQTDFTLEYKQVPNINEIAKNIGKEDGFSFAILELSKYGNSNEDSMTCDVNLMKSFFENSNLDVNNFFIEELSILNPDIIITNNIWASKLSRIMKYIDKYVFYNDSIKEIKSNNNAVLYSISINGRIIPLIDTYHFSAIGKNAENIQTEKYFYNPIMKLVKSEKYRKIFIE